MNYFFSALVIAFIIMGYVFANGVESITPEESFKLQSEKKAIIIDVREQNEVSSIGKVKGALVIPMSLMDNDRQAWEKKLADLDKTKTIILYCHSGRRAGIVGGEIVKKGFKVFNLRGFDAWKLKNLPIE